MFVDLWFLHSNCKCSWTVCCSYKQVNNAQFSNSNVMLLLGVNKIEKLFTSFWIIPKYAQHSRCHRFAIDLLNTSHHHTHVTVKIQINANIKLTIFSHKIINIFYIKRKNTAKRAVNVSSAQYIQRSKMQAIHICAKCKNAPKSQVLKQ